MRGHRFSTPSPIAAALLSFGVGAMSWVSPVSAQELEQEDVEREAETTDAPDGEAEDGQRLADRIQAVERKLFLKEGRFELMPFVALDLNDAFFQHLFVGAAAAYHFHDSAAFELRGGFAVVEAEKDSIRFVRVATDSLLYDSPSLVGHAEGNLTWAPIYGKISLLSESILHFDTFLTGGLGVFASQRVERTDGELEEITNVNPAFNIGIGQRYFINEWLVFRIELRNYTYIDTFDVEDDGATITQTDVQNVTLLGIALSGFFPTSFEYRRP